MLVGVWFLRRRKRNNCPIRAIALLQGRARLLSNTKLRAAITRAWGVHLPDNPPEDAENFVVVAPGTPSAMARIEGVMYLINSFPVPYMSEPEKAAEGIRDLRLRTVVADHKAWMSVDLLGDMPEGWDERTLYNRLGKLAAEIAAEDTLGFFLTQFDLLYPHTAETLAALRSDDVLASLRSDAPLPVVQVSDDDPAMKKAVEEAQSRLPEFVRRFESKDGQHFSIKAPVTSAGNTEFIWIDVTAIEHDRVLGTLGNDPANLPGYKYGQRVRIPMDDVMDWMIVTDRDAAKYDGGFSVAVVMAQYKKK